MKVIVLLCCAFAVAFGASNSLWNDTDLDTLKTTVLKDYDVHVRPNNYKTATDLWVGMSVLHMEIIEATSTLETHAWIRMNWTDIKMKWDPAKFNGISNLRLSADDVWQPDLTVYNSAEDKIVDHYAKTNKIAYNTGSVLWVPTSKFKTYCSLDLKMWPFDQQKCDIKLGSWTYDAYQLKLVLADSPIELEHYYKNLEWVVVESSAKHNSRKYDCCPEPYEDITFSFTLKRRAPMYKAIAVIPTVAIVFMVLIAFWLPPDAGEKLILNGFACVLVCILLIYFTQLLPVMSAASPLIVSFYSQTLYLLAASLIISAFVINISRKKTQTALPSFIKTVFLDNFIETIFSCKVKSTGKAESTVEDGNAGSDNATQDWIRFAVIIDRIAFVVYVIIFICMGFFHLV
ncbi:neuronal acetylcholine receptor subunit alpha-6-like [Chironomus tepperi]|uniref:neuronal acetylcholine receptor subunit alpha-6-like n=1 Tax=Chironomus tepperi TaxID=113505 RepID=UPI00391F4D0A